MNAFIHTLTAIIHANCYCIVIEYDKKLIYLKSHCHTYNTATPIALTIAMLKDTMCGQSDDRNCIHGKDVFIVSTAKLSEILNSVDCSILATLSHLAIGRKSNFVVRIPPPAIIH